jgi:hypothetical protein
VLVAFVTRLAFVVALVLAGSLAGAACSGDEGEGAAPGPEATTAPDGTAAQTTTEATTEETTTEEGPPPITAAERRWTREMNQLRREMTGGFHRTRVYTNAVMPSWRRPTRAAFARSAVRGSPAASSRPPASRSGRASGPNTPGACWNRRSRSRPRGSSRRRTPTGTTRPSSARWRLRAMPSTTSLRPARVRGRSSRSWRAERLTARGPGLSTGSARAPRGRSARGRTRSPRCPCRSRTSPCREPVGLLPARRRAPARARSPR